MAAMAKLWFRKHVELQITNIRQKVLGLLESAVAGSGLLAELGVGVRTPVRIVGRYNLGRESHRDMPVMADGT
jgi:hypothetical protein